MRILVVALLFFAACDQPGKGTEAPETIKTNETIRTIYIERDRIHSPWVRMDSLQDGWVYTMDTNAIVYLETADSSLRLPDSVGQEGDEIIFTGNYIQPLQQRKFRYSAYEVIKRVSSPLRAASDTLIIFGKSAILYGPDSAREESIKKKIGEEYYRIGRGDYAYSAYESTQFLQSAKLPVLYTEGKKFLKFIQYSGSITIIKIDTLGEYIGLYLFDPSKSPELADMTDIEPYYEKYFKQ